MHTPEQVKLAMQSLKDWSDDQLVHHFKIISSKHTKAEKTLYKPLMTAIEKERRARGTVSTISSKQPKLTTNSTADMYEGTEVVPEDLKD